MVSCVLKLCGPAVQQIYTTQLIVVPVYSIFDNSFKFPLLHILQNSDEYAVVEFLHSLVESREQAYVKSFLCR